jgi:hypothetical protein
MQMSKWQKKSGNAVAAPEPEPETPTTTHQKTRTQDGGHPRAGIARVTETAATTVRVIAMIICVLLALHIAFVMFKANEANSIVRTINSWAHWFAWRFRDMFVPKDERVGVLVNYGIAAVVYLIAGRVVSGLIGRIR